MGFKSISAHDLMKSHFCVTCGVHEVKEEGDSCNYCKDFFSAFKGDGPSQFEIAMRKREHLGAVVEIPVTSEETIQARREGRTQKCAREGCNVPVTYGVRGLGVYCNVAQANGKSHRQERIEELALKRSQERTLGAEIEDGEFEEVEDKPRHELTLAVLPTHSQGRELVHHPDHYGGADNPYETIKVIEAWELGFHLGNAVKYISRAGKESAEEEITDLEKARFYLDREIQLRKDAHAQEGVQQGES